MAEKKAAAKKKAAPRPASERAQEALDTAVRVVTATKERLGKAKNVVAQLELELERAQARQEYAAMNPDLPQSGTPAPDADPAAE